MTWQNGCVGIERQVIRSVRIRLLLAAPVTMQLSLRYNLKAGQGTDNRQLKSRPAGTGASYLHTGGVTGHRGPAKRRLP